MVMLVRGTLKKIHDPEYKQDVSVGDVLSRHFCDRYHIKTKRHSSVSWDRAHDSAHVVGLTALQVAPEIIMVVIRFRKLDRNPQEGEDILSVPYKWSCSHRVCINEDEFSKLEHEEFSFPPNTEY